MKELQKNVFFYIILAVFINLVTTFYDYFKYANNYYSLCDKYKENRWRRSVIVSEKELSDSKKKCDEYIDKLCDNYCKLLLVDETYLSVADEIQVFEGIYQYIVELAKKSQIIDEKYLKNIIIKIGYILRGKKFNKEEKMYFSLLL